MIKWMPRHHSDCVSALHPRQKLGIVIKQSTEHGSWYNECSWDFQVGSQRGFLDLGLAARVRIQKRFDCVAFSFKKSVENLIDGTGEKALYVCKNLKKCVTF